MNNILSKINFKKLKKIPKGVLVLLLILGIILLFLSLPSKKEKTIYKNLEDEVKVKKVKISRKKTIIDYEQPLDIKNTEGFITNWIYILALIVKTTPEAETIVLNCSFEDGGKARITAPADYVRNFIAGEISIEEFFQNIKVEPLTKGPKMD